MAAGIGLVAGVAGLAVTGVVTGFLTGVDKFTADLPLVGVAEIAAAVARFTSSPAGTASAGAAAVSSCFTTG